MGGHLFIVRHGEAEGNSDHRFIGQADVPLSETGRHQSQAIADHLAERGIGRIIASDLSRAIDTARPLAEKLALPITTDPRLREILNGDWAMCLPEEVKAGWPDLWARYQAGEDVPRPNGERWTDVGRRVRAVLAELESSPTGSVAVFAHGGPVLWSAYWALGIHLDVNLFHGPLHPASNASITSISLPGPKLDSYNETGHLRGDLEPESDLLPFMR